MSALARWHSHQAVAGSRRRAYPVQIEPWASRSAAPAAATVGSTVNGVHPLADPRLDAALQARQREIETRFAGIEPMLASLARDAAVAGRCDAVFDALRQRYGLVFADAPDRYRWAKPTDWGALYAHCVLAAFVELANRTPDLALMQQHDGEPVEEVVARWGFHAIDIVPCADGRLSGLTDHILRVPRKVIASRRSYAGAMFDIEAALEVWRAVELGRRAQSGTAAADTRYLKLGVYHFSGSQPHHEGCAAHGSDAARAARALLDRLNEFGTAVAAIHGERVALLMVGVDTDDDSIRVHVPDAAGEMSTERWLSSAELRTLTARLGRDQAKALIRDRVAACAGVAADDPRTEGMRWFCGYLLKNNIGQVEAVHRLHGGRYPELGHAERLIVAGDPIDEVQLRNVAFQTQFTTFEEGAADMAVGLRLLGQSHRPRALAVPILASARYDHRLPNGRARAAERARRHARAILSGPQQLGKRVALVVRAAVVDEKGHIEFADQPSLDAAHALDRPTRCSA